MGRPGYPWAVWQEFWVGVRQGASVEEAAVRAGVSRPVAYRHFAASGGVIPPRCASVPTAVPRARGRLSYAEREEIAILLAAGHGPREIARRLGRAASTISREVKNNSSTYGYRARVAQLTTETRARVAGQRASPAKLATNLELRVRVQELLKLNHSPEQISGRLRVEYPDRAEMWVSHETIYRSLFVQARGALKKELLGHLRSRRRIRRPRHAVDGRQGDRIADAVPIRERPAEAEDRAVPGHWEGDLVEGSRGTFIATLVERRSRFVILVKLSEKRTDVVVDALIKAVRKLPTALRKSLTWDRGSELTDHAKFTVATDVKVYFCDPYSPWQRGSNENTNGLLRQYYPKGMDLSAVSQAQLDAVAKKLNTRPRETLGWKTPAHVLETSVSTIH
jgi:IS30 family transposase